MVFASGASPDPRNHNPPEDTMTHFPRLIIWLNTGSNAFLATLCVCGLLSVPPVVMLAIGASVEWVR